MLSITQPNHSVDKRTLNSSDTFGILIYSPTGKVKMNLAQCIKTVSELKGQFTLRSGMVSNTYFDKYQFESDPKLLKQIAEAMSVLIPSNTDILCGLEMGGIPIVTMLSQISGLPSAFIRKAAKSYGTCRYAEGPNLANRQLLIVEDVVSSGGAIIEAASKMKADGLYGESAICVIDRQTGGSEKLAEHGIKLKALLTADQLT